MFTNKVFIRAVIAFIVLSAIGIGTILLYTNNREAKFNYAINAVSEGNYTEAINAFERLGVYLDSATRADEARYEYALLLLEQESPDFDSASNMLSQIKAPNFKDTEKLINGLDTYKLAVQAINNSNYQLAISSFAELGDYANSADLLKKAKYLHGKDLLDAGDLSEAITFLDGLKYDDSQELADNARIKLEIARKDLYHKAVDLFDTGNYNEARSSFVILGDYKESQTYINDIDEIVQRLTLANTIAAGTNHSLAISQDGNVAATGVTYGGILNVGSWASEEIVSVAARGSLSLGLRRDGKVVATGAVNGQSIPSPIPDWEKIVSISAGDAFCIGLTSDGKVRPFGHDAGDGQSNVDAWEDIIAISAGPRHSVGLQTDGTVLVAGYQENSQQAKLNGLIDKNNPVIAVAAGGGYNDEPGNAHTVVLRQDGTVRVVFSNEDEKFSFRDVEKWYNPATDTQDQRIIAIATGDWHIVGLRANGTVVTTYPNENNHEHLKEKFPDKIEFFKDDVQNVADWKNIVAINAGSGYTLALQSDGTVVQNGYGNGRPDKSSNGSWMNVAVYEYWYTVNVVS